MLSYQSGKEEKFYKGMFVSTSSELGEFAGDDPESSTEFIFSISRNSRLQDLLDKFLIHINKSLSKLIQPKEKIHLLDTFLKTANEYRLKQQVIFRKERNRVNKCVTNQNLGFMNALINELENKKLNIISSVSDNGKQNHNFITLQTKYSEEQLKKLYRQLIDQKYIADKTTENDFIYLFTGKTLNGVSKIKWLRSKKLAIGLLDLICINFSFITVNNCIEKANCKKFDSNDRSALGYNDFKDILKRIE